jgi:hypothetical protein
MDNGKWKMENGGGPEALRSPFSILHSPLSEATWLKLRTRAQRYLAVCKGLADEDVVSEMVLVAMETRGGVGVSMALCYGRALDRLNPRYTDATGRTRFWARCRSLAGPGALPRPLLTWPPDRDPWLPWHRLTPQERAAIGLFLRGYTSAEIARELGCVESRVSQIYRMAVHVLRGGERHGKPAPIGQYLRQASRHSERRGHRTTVCHRGHPRTPHNTVVFQNGKATCRVCYDQVNAHKRAGRRARRDDN